MANASETDSEGKPKTDEGKPEVVWGEVLAGGVQPLRDGPRLLRKRFITGKGASSEGTVTVPTVRRVEVKSDKPDPKVE